MTRPAPRLLLLALAGTLLAGCSGPALVNALTPGEGYRVENGTAYGTDPRQRYDLYVPDAAGLDAPVVVFFYGGNWQHGSRDLYPFVGQAFASRGYVTAIPDYRLYPQVGWRGFLADGAAAVTAIAARLPGRPLFLVGHSAGAYIAAMLALDPEWLGRNAACPLVRAAVGLAGPYDFLPLDEDDLKEIFGPGSAAPETQPIFHVDPTDPPLLLATGDDDDVVRPGNTLRLAARLREAGVPVATRLYSNLGHVALVAALAAPLRFIAPVLDDIDRFLSSAARNSACR